MSRLSVVNDEPLPVTVTVPDEPDNAAISVANAATEPALETVSEPVPDEPTRKGAAGLDVIAHAEFAPVTVTEPVLELGDAPVDE